jgi:hypothetical protein
MKFKLPVWNGVKNSYEKQKIRQIEIKSSIIKGIFTRKDNNFVDYEKNYVHMTPLKWRGYIADLRNTKINFIKENLKSVGSCLDIGGGDDFNLKSLNWKRFVICDPFAKSYKKKDIEFIGDFYEKINFKEKFDTIIMFSVLEHTKNLFKFLEKTKKILNKNGHFFLEIPIIDDQFLNADLNCLLHEHINYFSKRGIFTLMKKFNFEIEAFYIKNDNGFFCIRHVAQKKKFFLEKNLPDLSEFQKIFNKKILNFVGFLKKNKYRRIIFYGANNGLNNLLYICQKKIKIKKDKILIVDSDSNKWGKYIGSNENPIQKPSIIKKSDLVCISSLSFYNEIVAKLSKNNQIISLHDI